MENDPERPNRFLPQKEDYVYGSPNIYQQPGEEDSVVQSEAPGQELFEIHKRPPTPQLLLPDDSYFYLNISGQIESAQMLETDSLTVKYDFVEGNEWELIQGQNSGSSQCCFKGNKKNLVFNFPFRLSYRSVNPKGWPQLVVTCIGPDFLGREVVKGYGNTYVPIQPGSHTKTLYLYKPKSSSYLVQFVGWLRGKTPELMDPKRTVGLAEGREVTRMESAGTLKVVFNLTQLNMDHFGYSVKRLAY